jgi:hypothetical protein
MPENPSTDFETWKKNLPPGSFDRSYDYLSKEEKVAMQKERREVIRQNYELQKQSDRQLYKSFSDAMQSHFPDSVADNTQRLTTPGDFEQFKENVAKMQKLGKTISSEWLEFIQKYEEAMPLGLGVKDTDLDVHIARLALMKSHDNIPINPVILPLVNDAEKARLDKAATEPVPVLARVLPKPMLNSSEMQTYPIERDYAVISDFQVDGKQDLADYKVPIQASEEEYTVVRTLDESQKGRVDIDKITQILNKPDLQNPSADTVTIDKVDPPKTIRSKFVNWIKKVVGYDDGSVDKY